MQAHLPDGTSVLLRPLQHHDRERLRRLGYRLSPETLYRRFLTPVARPTEEALDRLLALDHWDREAIAAVEGDEIIAVARYARQPGGDVAEVAVVVADDRQHQGVGRLLLRHLAWLARRRGIRAFAGNIAGDNRPALELVRSLSPAARTHWSTGEVEFEAPIEPRPAPDQAS